jgi:hypothetical protein
MMLFVSGATRTAKRFPVGELIVPEANNAPESLKLLPGQWAGDCGVFNAPFYEVDVALFVRMLERFAGRTGCRFMAAPDRPYDAHQTLMQWPFWSRVIRAVGFPPALVAQDGMTIGDVPWSEVSALFVGGSTEWKLGPHAEQLISYAKARGLWVHVGRINSQQRMWEFARKGVDSWDGTKYSRWSERWIPEAVETSAAIDAQQRLV